MVTIDDELYAKRGFSGRVVVSFHRGVMKQITIEETVPRQDPEMVNKLLIHGIKIDSGAPADAPKILLKGGAGQG